MSLVSSSLCMFKRNIPVDIVNAVIEYIGAKPNARWIPRFNLRGELCWNLNKEAFNGLSDICSFKPVIYRNFRLTSRNMVFNGVEQEKPCSTVLLIAPKLISPDTIRTTLYATVEIAPNVFDHISVLCDWGVGEVSGVTNFIKGSLYRPYEAHKWNREQNITSIHIGNHSMSVEHSEVIFMHTWNAPQNMWEYVAYDHTPVFDPYPIWVHDTEEDNIGWA
jgi:hypothetical protein